jgi:hypothetical protein
MGFDRAWRWTTLALLLLSSLSPVAEGAQRHFVSTYGNDGANCTLAQPCRSFSAAIAVVDAGGEVIVLDSGGYGPVTIDKIVSISAPPGVYAGISVLASTPAITGIVVNPGGPGAVTLRGLSLVNLSGEGAVGIDVVGPTWVRVQGCTLDGFFDGIRIGADATAGSVVVSETTIRGGFEFSGRGIALENNYITALVVVRSLLNGQGRALHLVGFHNVEVVDTVITGAGVGIYAAATAAQPDNGSVSLERVSLLDNFTGIHLSGQSPRIAVANVSNSTISGNRTIGARAADRGYLRLAGTQVTANQLALVTEGTGAIASLGDNLCAGNGQPCIAATPIAPY